MLGCEGLIAFKGVFSAHAVIGNEKRNGTTSRFTVALESQTKLGHLPRSLVFFRCVKARYGVCASSNG